MSLLTEAYLQIPQPELGDDADLFAASTEDARREFRQLVRARYTEGTLCRLVQSCDSAVARRAAAVALGMVGTFASNLVLAVALKDDDGGVPRAAADALWEVWFRGDTDDQARELRTALSLFDGAERLAALDDVVSRFPEFAEAHNQRAMVRYGRGQYSKAAADCEAVLRLNPVHFGAASGLGQCHLRMNKPKAALRAFVHALGINPTLMNLREAVAELRAKLGEEG